VEKNYGHTLRDVQNNLLATKGKKRNLLKELISSNLLHVDVKACEVGGGADLQS
jgi:hypothetical protein